MSNLQFSPSQIAEARGIYQRAVEALGPDLMGGGVLDLLADNLPYDLDYISALMDAAGIPRLTPTRQARESVRDLAKQLGDLNEQQLFNLAARIEGDLLDDLHYDNAHWIERALRWLVREEASRRRQQEV